MKSLQEIVRDNDSGQKRPRFYHLYYYDKDGNKTYIKIKGACAPLTYLPVYAQVAKTALEAVGIDVHEELC